MGCYRQPRLTVKDKLHNILVNAGFTLISEFWTQRGDYRKATWDLAVWGVEAELEGRRVSVCSWQTMTEIVRAGSVTWSKDGEQIEIFAQSNKTAAEMLVAGQERK
jgi:hypothetical protein